MRMRVRSIPARRSRPNAHCLTRWGMQLAAKLLVEPAETKIAAVAEAVGCESEAAFSRAFKKSVGVSPAAWRVRQAA